MTHTHTHTRLVWIWSTSGTAAYGDSYEAKIISVTRSLSNDVIFFSRNFQNLAIENFKKQKESWIKLFAPACCAVMSWAAALCDMFSYSFPVAMKRTLLQTATTEARIPTKYLVLELRQAHMLHTSHKHTEARTKGFVFSIKTENSILIRMIAALWLHLWFGRHTA